MTLTNIGPFDHLDLELDPRWNILLGDNGVGKSNVLRAIAAALAGATPSRSASGSSSSTKPAARSS